MNLDQALDKYLAVLRERLLAGRYDEFVQIQNQFYSEIIKKKEDRSHYEKCFGLLDDLNREYGRILKQGATQKPSTREGGPTKILIAIPNIDNDLAHIELLGNLLRHVDPNKHDIAIFGFGNPKEPPQSQILMSLYRQGKIKLLKVPDSHGGRIGLLNFYHEQQFDRLAVYSIPMIISAWLEALGEDAVCWVSTKFELDSFKGLSQGISLTQTSNPTTNPSWRTVTPGIAVDYAPALQIDTKRRTRLLTINREEKIAHPQFLEAVVALLTNFPECEFSWTGRSHHPGIQSVFDRNGVAERCHFLGWVDPKATLAEHDIFLDTPSLSGYVATMAFASGLPTYLFANSQNWVQIHAVAAAETLGIETSRLLATNTSQYVQEVTAGITSPEAYQERSVMQKTFSETFLFREKEACDELLTALSEG